MTQSITWKLYYVVAHRVRYPVAVGVQAKPEARRFFVSEQSEHGACMFVQQYIQSLDWRCDAPKFLCQTFDKVFREYSDDQ